MLQYRPARKAAIRIDAVLEGLRGIVGEPIRIVAQEVPAIKRENSGKLRPIIDLSTIAGEGRDRLLRDLHLADFRLRHRLLPDFIAGYSADRELVLGTRNQEIQGRRGTADRRERRRVRRRPAARRKSRRAEGSPPRRRSPR